MLLASPLSDKQLAPIFNRMARLSAPRMADFKRQLQTGAPAPGSENRYLSLPEVAELFKFSIEEVQEMISWGHIGQSGERIRLCAVEVLPGCLLVPYQALMLFGQGLPYVVGQPPLISDPEQSAAWQQRNWERYRLRFRRLHHCRRLFDHPAWRRQHPGQSRRRRTRPKLKLTYLFKMRCFVRRLEAEKAARRPVSEAIMFTSDCGAA